MNRFDRFSQTPSKSRFVRLLTNALRKAGEKSELRYDRAAFSLRTEGPTQRIFWLNNAYKEFCAAGAEQRQMLLRNFIRSWLVPDQPVPENYEDVHPDLLPAVRSRSYYEVTLLHLQAEGHKADDRVYRRLAEHLAVGLAYDLPGAIVQIGQHNLDGWKVSFDEALKAALVNMRGLTKEPLRQAVPGVWVSPYHDNHDASRLVLTELIRDCEVRGDPVALVPNRDILLVTGSDDTAGLVAAGRFAEDVYQKPRFLSGVAVRLTGNQWVPYLPPPDHPAYLPLRRLRIHDLSRDYAQQSEALKAISEKKGDDVFVASSSLLRKKDNDEVISYSVWSDGIETLLPEADMISFFRLKGEKDGEIVAHASWQRVREVVGDLMTPMGFYPERYRVSAFPTAEQLAALGKTLPL
jgi:hypothetical protein